MTFDWKAVSVILQIYILHFYNFWEREREAILKGFLQA